MRVFAAAHRHLFRQVGDVDEAGGDGRFALRGEVVQQAVEQVVADVGASRVGDTGRDALRLDVRDHFLDRQRCPVGDRAASDDGFINRLVAFVVGDTEVVDIDADAFHRDVRAAARLTDGNDGIGLHFFNRRLHGFQRLKTHHRDFPRDDFVAVDSFALQAFRHFQRGVDGFAVEGLEAGNQQFFHGLPRYSEAKEVHQKDIDAEHDERHRDLRLDDAVFVVHFQKRRWNDIEVGGHRRHQRAAITGQHGNRRDNQRVGVMQLDGERDANASRHHRKSSESVAHDDGEEGHADAVSGGDGEADMGRHDLRDDVGNGATNAGLVEERTESGEQLREDGGPADGIEQAAAFMEGLQRRASGNEEHKQQRQQRGDTEADERAEVGNARPGDEKGEHTDAEHRDEKQVAEARGGSQFRSRCSFLVFAFTQLLGGDDDRHQDDQPASNFPGGQAGQFGEMIAAVKGNGINNPEYRCANPFRVLAVNNGQNAEYQQT